MVHPVDIVYGETRAAWKQYVDMSTPWPADMQSRIKLMKHRMVIDETRLRLLEAYEPKDRRLRMEMRNFQTNIDSDKKFIAKYENSNSKETES